MNTARLRKLETRAAECEQSRLRLQELRRRAVMEPFERFAIFSNTYKDALRGLHDAQWRHYPQAEVNRAMEHLIGCRRDLWMRFEQEHPAEAAVIREAGGP